MISQKDFLNKYNITIEDFDKTLLNWKDLMKIYVDYQQLIPQLESTADMIFKNLIKLETVHSVRYRIKDSEHLIAKIIRKKIDNSNRIINFENYKTEITDLIGLRVLHLFKSQWEPIHEYIKETWDLKEHPTVNYREGDDKQILDEYKKKNCLLKVHKAGYRSIHYIVETKPAKIIFYTEIQVRTIYEEAWSEIDHKIKYPYYQDNLLINDYLLILNRLSRSADEMGSFVSSLKDELERIHLDNIEKLKEKEDLIFELKKEISNITNKKQRDKMAKTFENFEDLLLINKSPILISTSAFDRKSSFSPEFNSFIENYNITNKIIDNSINPIVIKPKEDK